MNNIIFGAIYIFFSLFFLGLLVYLLFKKRTFIRDLMIGISLLMVSAALYSAHYTFFHDSHFIFAYLLEHLSFMPVSAFIMTAVVGQILKTRDKKKKKDKMSVLISAFYSRSGNDLLKMISKMNNNSKDVADVFLPENMKQLKAEVIINKIKSAGIALDINESNLNLLKERLNQDIDFYFNVIQDENLLEHEAFTDIIWAAIHLQQELTKRDSLKELYDKDKEHLIGDIERLYNNLISVWPTYLLHLKKDYPFLYSLVIRDNPFLLKSEVYIK